MSNATTIATLLRQAGFNSNAVNGILGNLDIESNENPGAYNASEHAIGIAQWEGGRRTNLQAFARSRGTSETDLRTQVAFLIQELHGMPNTIAALNHSGSAGDAAAIFDAQFERSAGTSRQQRINAALAYAGGHGGAGTTTNAPLNQMDDQTPGGAPGGLSAEDYQSALGSMSGLMDSVPELKNILNQAITGQWTANKFQQKVQQSHWYKTHSESVRQTLALQVADPATYKQNLSTMVDQVKGVAGQLGVDIESSGHLQEIAEHALLNGWSQEQLQRNISNLWRSSYYAHGKLSGQAATIMDQLQQVADAYGYPTTKGNLSVWAQQILSGTNTVEGYKQAVIKGAQSLYPGISHQITADTDVKTIADPYVSTMANLLEIDPGSIKFQSDPMIKRALQGTSVADTGHAGTAATRAVTPLWQFEEQVRNDPRWNYTNNAKDSISTALLHIGKDFGFGGF